MPFSRVSSSSSNDPLRRLDCEWRECIDARDGLRPPLWLGYGCHPIVWRKGDWLRLNCRDGAWLEVLEVAGDGGCSTKGK